MRLYWINLIYQFDLAKVNAKTEPYDSIALNQSKKGTINLGSKTNIGVVVLKDDTFLYIMQLM